MSKTISIKVNNTKVTNIYENSYLCVGKLTGNGYNYADTTVDFRFKANTYYNFVLKSTTIPQVSNLIASHTIIRLGYKINVDDASDVEIFTYYYKSINDIPKETLFTIPVDAEILTVGGRAISGYEIEFYINESVTYNNMRKLDESIDSINRFKAYQLFFDQRYLSKINGGGILDKIEHVSTEIGRIARHYITNETGFTCYTFNLIGGNFYNLNGRITGSSYGSFCIFYDMNNNLISAYYPEDGTIKLHSYTIYAPFNVKVKLCMDNSVGIVPEVFLCSQTNDIPKKSIVRIQGNNNTFRYQSFNNFIPKHTYRLTIAKGWSVPDSWAGYMFAIKSMNSEYGDLDPSFNESIYSVYKHPNVASPVIETGRLITFYVPEDSKRIYIGCRQFNDASIEFYVDDITGYQMISADNLEIINNYGVVGRSYTDQVSVIIKQLSEITTYYESANYKNRFHFIHTSDNHGSYF